MRIRSIAAAPGIRTQKFISSILQYVSETLIYANSEIDDIEKKIFPVDNHDSTFTCCMRGYELVRRYVLLVLDT